MKTTGVLCFLFVFVSASTVSGCFFERAHLIIEIDDDAANVEDSGDIDATIDHDGGDVTAIDSAIDDTGSVNKEDVDVEKDVQEDTIIPHDAPPADTSVECKYPTQALVSGLTATSTYLQYTDGEILFDDHANQTISIAGELPVTLIATGLNGLGITLIGGKGQFYSIKSTKAQPCQGDGKLGSKNCDMAIYHNLKCYTEGVPAGCISQTEFQDLGEKSHMATNQLDWTKIAINIKCE